MLAVIGCGNPNRQDDGVGVAVAQRLSERLRRHPVPDVKVFDCGTAGMEVMFAARGADALVVVDACRSGGEPGSVYEVPGEELAQLPTEPSFNLHDFRWDHALAAGRKIYGDAFPQEVDVFLVEAAATGFGLEMSPEVEAAADTVYRRLLSRVADYAAQRHGAASFEVTIRRGSVRVDGDAYARVFRGLEGAVVLPEDDHLRVMPVDPRAGGVLVKLRNPQGDRVFDATDALTALGWEQAAFGPEVSTFHAVWDPERGALEIRRSDPSHEPRERPEGP
jgi:hydrogenase maturation protease